MDARSWGRAFPAAVLAAWACLIGSPGGAISADPPAPIAVKAIVPGGVAAGTTTNVRADGSFPRWPTDVWTDRDGLVWKPLEEKGAFEVTAAADAIGVYRVRFHDAAGATAVRRFVVGRDRELAEVEPDDLPRQAQPLETMPVTVNGVLSKSGDADCFSVALEAGQTLVATLDAHRGPGSPVDAVLDLVDDRGGYLARTLDSRGLDPRVVFTASRNATVVLRVWGFPSEPNSTIGLAGGPEFVYRLSVTTGPWLAGTLPLALARTSTTSLSASGWNLPEGLQALVVPASGVEAVGTAASPSVSTATARDERRWITFPGVGGAVELPVVNEPVLTGPAVGDGDAIEPPFVASARFDKAGGEVTWRMNAKKDESLSIAVVGHVEGYEADTVLEIRDDSGKRLLAKTERDPAFLWKPPADGTFVVALRERRGKVGPAHLVRLSVVPESPGLALSSVTDAVTIAIGGKAEVPITVDRIGGFKEPVEVRLIDPPGAINATAATSADGESAKKVTLVIEAKAAFSGPVRMEGAGAAVRCGPEQLPVLWLTIPDPGPATPMPATGTQP